jgi:predicted PurR-regulated permease PerM
MTVKQYPFYLKATVILIGLFYLVSILNLLSGILVPFAFAVLFSILLNPLYNRLLRFKMPRPLAVLLTLLIGIGFMVLIGYLLSTQVAQFGKSFPILKVRFGQMTDSLESWISVKFGVSI